MAQDKHVLHNLGVPNKKLFKNSNKCSQCVGQMRFASLVMPYIALSSLARHVYRLHSQLIASDKSICT